MSYFLRPISKLFFLSTFQSQLQQFLLFILKCEQGLEVKDLDDVDQPTWWPKDLPFDNSLVLHSTKKGVSFSLP